MVTACTILNTLCVCVGAAEGVSAWQDSSHRPLHCMQRGQWKRPDVSVKSPTSPPSHGPSNNMQRFPCAALFSLIVSPATFILLCLGTMKPPQLPKCGRITFNFGPLLWIWSLPPRQMVSPVFWEVVWKLLLICFWVPQLLCVPHQLWAFS